MKYVKCQDFFDTKIFETNTETFFKIKSFENFVARATKRPEKVEDYFDSTQYGKASEKTHSASNQTQLGLNGHLKTTLISIPLMLHI